MVITRVWDGRGCGCAVPRGPGMPGTFCGAPGRTWRPAVHATWLHQGLAWFPACPSLHNGSRHPLVLAPRPHPASPHRGRRGCYCHLVVIGSNAYTEVSAHGIVGAEGSIQLKGKCQIREREKQGLEGKAPREESCGLGSNSLYLFGKQTHDRISVSLFLI